MPICAAVVIHMNSFVATAPAASPRRIDAASGSACGNCHPSILPQWQGNAHGGAVANREAIERIVRETGLSVEVGGVEYAYTGLPRSLPAGTELTFRNDGNAISPSGLAYPGKVSEDMPDFYPWWGERAYE